MRSALNSSAAASPVEAQNTAGAEARSRLSSKRQDHGAASRSIGKNRPASANRFFEPLESRQLMSASLISGGIVPGSISAQVPTQSYAFTEPAGAKVQIETDQSNAPGFVSRFTLYDQTNRVITFWNGHSGTPELTLTGGNYTLKVTSWDGKTFGSYSIGLEGLSPISPGPAALVKGGIVSGSISSRIGAKEYIFNANAGAKVQIETHVNGPNWVPQFTLYDSAGDVIHSWIGGDGVPPLTLSGGQYMLKVNSWYTDSTGSFSIGLEGLSPVSPGAVPLPNGTSVNGSITTPIGVDEYTFNTGAGASMQFQTNSNFVTHYTLYDSAGDVVHQWLSGGTTLLLPGGQYMLKVDAWDAVSTGNYSVKMSEIAAL